MNVDSNNNKKNVPPGPNVWDNMVDQYSTINQIITNERNPDRVGDAVNLMISYFAKFGDPIVHNLLKKCKNLSKKQLLSEAVTNPIIHRWNLWYWRSQNIIRDVCVDYRLLDQVMKDDMNKLKSWLVKADTVDEKIHAVVWFFCDFMRVHPFQYGNGRVGRIWLQWSIRSTTGKELNLSKLETCKQLDERIADASFRFFRDNTFALLFEGNPESLIQALSITGPSETPLTKDLKKIQLNNNKDNNNNGKETQTDKQWYYPVLEWVLANVY